MKRMIGKKFTDPFIQESIKHWPFKVLNGNDANLTIKVADFPEWSYLTVEQVIGILLEHIKHEAESFLGHQVTEVVLSIPRFSQAYCKSMMEAASFAGLKVLRLYSDTALAAVKYFGSLIASGHMKTERPSLIINVGGGNLSAAFISVQTGSLIVKPVTDMEVGGEDFNQALAVSCNNIFAQETDEDLMTISKKSPLQILRSHCEEARHDLVSSEETEIIIDSLYDDKDFYLTISQSEYDDITRPVLKKIESAITVLLQIWRPRIKIEQVIIVGGLALVPQVRQLITKSLEVEDTDVMYSAMDAQEAVVSGLALQGSVDSGAWLPILNKTWTDLCYENISQNKISVIGQFSFLPTKRTKIVCISRLGKEKEESFGLSKHFPNAKILHGLNGTFKVYERISISRSDLSSLALLITECEYSVEPPVFYGCHSHLEITFDVSINGILKVSAQGTDKVCAGQEYFVPPSPVQRPVNAVVMAVPTFTRKRQLSDDGNAENRSANGSRKSAKVKESASAATIKSDFSGLQNYCWNVLALVEHDEVTNSISELEKKLVRENCERVLQGRVDEKSDDLKQLFGPIVTKALSTAPILRDRSSSPRSSNTSFANYTSSEMSEFTDSDS